MDEETIVAIIGGGFVLAAALGCLAKGRMARSHRKAGDFLGWMVTAVVLGVAALSLFLAPGAWVDGYGGLLRILGGGD